MLMSLRIAAASEPETYDFVDSAEVHTVHILFSCRDPLSTTAFNTQKSLASTTDGGGFRASGSPPHPPVSEDDVNGSGLFPLKSA